MSDSPLPYNDTKPVGAADFYFAINATFRFVFEKFGADGLDDYWRDLGRNYFAPVSGRWKAGGLPAVEEYWRAFFRAEPGAEVNVAATSEEVCVDVRVCPAIRLLREHGREVPEYYCRHCHVIGAAMAAPAGIGLRIDGGGGRCVQRFFRQEAR